MKIDLSKIPDKPGVYRFYDKDQKLLYIGKAKNLKNRVRSYSTKASDLTPAKQLMVKSITKVEYTIVANETEALLLESNLIKKYQPPFNIDLKDDKSWVYLCLTEEDFPKLIITRKNRDKEKYLGCFGPYTSAYSVKQTMRLLRKIFPYYTAKGPMIDLGKKAGSPYHLGRYLEKKELSQTEWSGYLQQIKDFLSGKTKEIIKNLNGKMAQAAKNEDYELAAKIRDQLAALTNILSKQQVVSRANDNEDYLNIFTDQKMAVITLLKVRQGKLLDQLNFIIKNPNLNDSQEILSQFIEKYYSQTEDLPKIIITPVKITPPQTTIKISLPKKGRKKELLNLALKNAEEFFGQQKTSWEKQAGRQTKRLKDLQTVLKLKKLPDRIECYDISNIQGSFAVGSMVVMTKGQIDKSQYRKFKIKTVKGANDPKMIAEVIKRRFENDWPLPDLIVIDGGPTQLNAAFNNLPTIIPIISLAKKQEEIYLPGEKIPLKLPKFSPALQLLQQIRDEAHRFAISYYRKLHSKNNRLKS